ncbi:hypothetical protein ACFQ6Q_04310 [Streptomyces sp. NPDC056437]|uniref:hypothetical protein n=1 Tax=Streptomyces sp. NPDC056437 TaxID=3345816 RepID=UPI0036914872
MSLNMPWRTKAKHRGASVLVGQTPTQLKQEIGRLKRALDRAKCDGMDLATQNAELRAKGSERDARFEQFAVDYAVLLEAKQRLEADNARLQGQLTETQAALANATAISAPAGVRDIDPDDQPTHPQGIHVQPLWDAAAAGLLGAVADPGQTSWGARRQADVGAA